MATTDPFLADPALTGTVDPASGGQPLIPDPNLLGGLEALAGIATNVATFIARALTAVSTEFTSTSVSDVTATWTRVVNHYEKMAGVFSFIEAPRWSNLPGAIFGELYKTYLQDGLGLQPDKFDDQGQAGVQTVDTMLGFAFVCQLAAMGLDAIGKPIMANRFFEAVSKAVMELPEEIGLTWAMGMQIDKAFEAAVGRSVEENINKQKRPNAPEWPVIRTLLRQHLIQPDDLTERLEAAGFEQKWIDRILKLADAQVPVGDVQNLYLHGQIGPQEAKTYIQELGFKPVDADRLLALYISNAETSASRTYVSVARQLFRDFLITEDHYRAILQAKNYPQLLIDDDVAAITLEHDTGRLNLSVAAIKAEYTRGNHDAQQATTELLRDGMTADAAAELIRTWDLPPQKREHGMSASKILCYLVSGIMDPSAARTRLLDTGLNQADVDFLMANPTAKPGVRVRPRTPGFITTAYLDGAVTLDALPQLYADAGVAPADIGTWVDIAKYRYAHKKPVSANGKPLTDADIREAFKNGIFDPQTAIADLVANGWSTENATVLLEITNKGQPLTPAPGPFSSLAQALAYLVEHGYVVHEPPDPNIAVALGMADAAGYGVTGPTTPISTPLWTPP